MDRVLVVANDKSAPALEELIRSQYRDARMSVAPAGSRARRALLDAAYDLVVISAPLTDENGVELAAEAASTGECGVVLLVRAEYADQISEKVEDFGVFVIDKPIHKPFFFRALRLVNASRHKVRGLQKERVKLEHKIEEIRMVDRAKCVLIQYLGITEPQAHRHIEKQAMDMRTTKKEVALGILKTYEV